MAEESRRRKRRKRGVNAVSVGEAGGLRCPDDADILRYSGLMGHTFTVIYTDENGERKKGGESLLFEDANRMIIEKHQGTIYKRLEAGWVAMKWT